jgi:glycogen operon protein
MLRSVPSDADGEPSSDVLVVINGALDPVEVTLADERPTAWELVWDSMWEEPGERRAASIGGGLHGASGAIAHVDELSLRVYIAR